jgi:hypothetical protein
MKQSLTKLIGYVLCIFLTQILASHSIYANSSNSDVVSGLAPEKRTFSYLSDQIDQLTKTLRWISDNERYLDE